MMLSRLWIAIDARLQVDLERDHDEPAGETSGTGGRAFRDRILMITGPTFRTASSRRR